MSWIARVPFWGWFLFYTGVSYTVWNPTGWSLLDYWRSSMEMGPMKALTMSIVTIILVATLVQTLRSLRWLGIVAYLVVFGIVLWGFHNLGILDLHHPSSSQWWGQIPIALFLTLGLRGNKIWRDLTSTVTVTEADSVGHHS